MTFAEIKAALDGQAAPFAPDRVKAVESLGQACSFIVQESQKLRDAILAMNEGVVAKQTEELRKSIRMFAERLPVAQQALRELAKADELAKP